MTRKDFRLITRGLRGAPMHVVLAMADELCAYPNFDRDRFVQACWEEE